MKLPKIFLCAYVENKTATWRFEILYVRLVAKVSTWLFL